MIRNLKALGLALVAVFAMSAVAASAASAAEGHSNSGSGTTFGKGEQTVQNVFTVNGGTVKCAGAVFTTSYPETTTKTLTVTPAYTGCTAFGQEATIDTNGCDYLFTQPTETTSTDNYHSVVDIKCPAGNKITVTVGDPAVVCTVTVGEQTPGKPLVDITDVTPTETQETAGVKKDLLVKSTVEEITYTSSGGICGKSGANGKYTGEVTLRGYSDAAFTNQVDIWVD